MKLLIVGCGNVGQFIAHNFKEFNLTDVEIEGFLDDDSERWGGAICGYPVLGGVNQLEKIRNSTSVVVGIGDPRIRKNIIDEYSSGNLLFPNLISKNVWISKEVSLGRGIIIYPGTQINFESSIGDFVIINMNCSIGHNSTISQFSTLSPGVSLGGFTHIEEGVLMGINSATKQGIQIGKNSIVGGMSMIVKDLPANVTAVGVPARVTKKNLSIKMN